MSHPRALSEQEAIDAEIWYRDYERVGSFSAKARELRIDRNTLYDSIKRVRGELTKNTREKMSAVEVDQLADQLLGGSFHVERPQTVEEQPPKRETV